MSVIRIRMVGLTPRAADKATREASHAAMQVIPRACRAASASAPPTVWNVDAVFGSHTSPIALLVTFHSHLARCFQLHNRTYIKNTE